MSDVRIDPSWKKALQEQFGLEYWQTLTSFVREEYKTKTIYPPATNIFKAFDLCPFDKVNVVIVGQDPYHGMRQAMGLSFSVNDGIAIPPSLQNIYKEIHDDLGITPHLSGDLTRWAKQGVLLLNSVLTVQASQPASHAKKGWEQFTDAAIQALNSERKNIVYLLWGKYAQTKGLIINREQNLVLTSAHPSPYSVTQFYGNHHFSQCNNYLEKQGLQPIDWR